MPPPETPSLPASESEPAPLSPGAAQRRARPLWTLGLLAGTAGGLAAASLDFFRALGAPDLSRTLPDGTLRLWAFLLTLYGAVAAASGGILGLAVQLLLRTTLLGPMLATGSEPGEEGEDGADALPTSATDRARRVPRWALLLAAAAFAGVLGALIHPVALGALTFFHHRLLLSLLVGASAAGLVLPAAIVAVLVASAFGRPPGSRGVPVRRRGPLSLYAVGWMLGLLLLAATVTLALFRLQQNPRMTPALRALNLALWAPALALGSLTLGHLVGRLLAGRHHGRGLLARGWAAVLLPAATAGLPIALGAALYRDTLRVLDLRPLVALLTACGAGLGAVAVLLRRPAPRRRNVVLLLVPLILWGAALTFGQHDRVRKAALAQVPLAGRIIQGAATVFDLDRDGAAARWVIGGTDCNDLDRDVAPGAFDWPDNGIDENCNGHDARLPRPESTLPWPALPPGLPAQPNIVLITVDALRADHVSGYGYPRKTTPNLDALATGPDGARFARAWAHAPSTRYSVPAILTGRYPSTIAWGPPHIHWPPEVLPENRLLSEMLHARGYRTTALLSYHYFEPTWGLARGFDDYDTHLEYLHSLGGDPAATSGSSARELADLALAKLPLLTAGPQPFFLWMHFYDPHFRYQPHPPPPGAPEFGSDEIDLYDGEIRYTDEHIGRVLAALRDSPAWPHTVVVVTSDHGEGLGEHGIPPDKRHGYHLYANQTQVPLLVRVPGLDAAVPRPPSPRVVEPPVGHVDLVPTVLQLVGGKAADEPQLLGRSLAPLLAGLPDPGAQTVAGERVVFQEVMYEGPTVRKALLTARWHLIDNLVPDGTRELYDVAADPLESRDLQGTATLRSEEAALQAGLVAWIDDSAVPPDFARRVAGNLSTTPLDAPQKLGAQLGDFLDVVAADVRTPTVTRGETAEIALILHAKKRIPPGYRLFVHLRGQAGGFVNADHDLLDGLLPPQRLRPGSFVRDTTRVAVPKTLPPGPATLVIGLFRREGRAPVSGPPGVADPEERVIRVARIELR